MIISIASICITVIINACIQRSCGRARGDCSEKPGGIYGSVECCTHFYFNGNVCTECPEGYFGVNCSNACQPPSYGTMCRATCDCMYSACHFIHGCSFTTAIIQRSCGRGNCSEKPGDNDGSVECCTHFYFNGNVCTECPEGYFGNNCSRECQPPSYGTLCRATCDCLNSACHFIHGCTFTTGNVTLEELETANQTPIARNNLVKILIISFGTLITITLLLLIGREILHYHSMSKMQNNPRSNDIPVAYNIYDDITEPQ